MTNANKIRSMTDEELKQFLVDIRTRNQAFDVHGYCKDNCPWTEKCEECGECIDPDPHSDIEWWLQQEAELKMLSEHYTWEFAERDDDFYVNVEGKGILPYEMSLSPVYKDDECMRVMIDGEWYHFG